MYKFVARPEHNNKHITCRISSDMYLIEDSTILKINFPPKFNASIPFMPNVQVLFGDMLSLSCSTEQSPPLQKIQWFFTKNYTNKSRELAGNSSSFTVREMSDGNEGTYECIVQNRIGKAHRKFIVEVLPKGMV